MHHNLLVIEQTLISVRDKRNNVTEDENSADADFETIETSYCIKGHDF
jgi:hypothetical protein